MSLTAIILTYNEAQHLARAIGSISSVASEVVVVDSFSTDNTVSIAEAAGARVYQRKFRHQADQFNWALEHVTISTAWVMRLDADEYIDTELAHSIRAFLPSAAPDISGVILQRRHIWMGKWVRFGGRYPLNLVRIWRLGRGRVEDRWMDEHVVITEGRLITLRGGFFDCNLNDVSFFTEKHNRYATREAIEVLNVRYSLFESSHDLPVRGGGWRTATKRLFKNRIYNRIPFPISAGLYFFWRFIFQLGFLDGRSGLIYHVLQGFWYRFLVGAKVMEYDGQLKSLATKEQRLQKLQELTGHQLITKSESS